jgi:hypothetical protein
MKINFFEKMIIKRLKNNKNKTKIKLCVNNIMDIYNPYSIIDNGKCLEDNNIKINNEIIEYLISETENIPKHDSLIIAIDTPEEIKSIEKIIKENIKDRIIKTNKETKKANRNASVLAVVGMLLIASTELFQINRYSLREFIIVMSWVFMWKAIETFFFERMKMTKEMAILLRIYLSEMEGIKK